MKLWIYWMDNEYKGHKKEMPNKGKADFEKVSKELNNMLNDGQIKDYQVELRK